MVSNVLAATAILRQHYRRLRSVGLLGSITALGLVPLALYMPRPEWARYALLALVCLYAGRKAVQFVHARTALKQLSMEEQFLRYGCAAGQVEKCIETDEHLWTRSCILAGLKGVLAHPFTSDMVGDEKRNRVYRQFKRSCRTLDPSHAFLDAGLLLAALVLLSVVPSIDIDLRAILFQAGFLAFTVAGVAEASHLMIHRRLVETLPRFLTALTDWTIREAFHSPVESSFSHHLLYFAPPWFVKRSDVLNVGTL